MHAVWHPFYHPESCSKEVSGLVAASAQEAHVIKGKRVNILKLEVKKNLVCMSKATCKKAEARQGKIYVGKLPVDEISNQDLSDHFSQVDQFLL